MVIIIINVLTDKSFICKILKGKYFEYHNFININLNFNPLFFCHAWGFGPWRLVPTTTDK